MSINKNIELLIELNISTKSSLEVFHRSTRDIDNLNVLKCNQSGVIVLERVEVDDSYYEENIHYTNEFKGETHVKNGVILTTPLEDDVRRFESYKELINNSKILDFGCGKGGFIQLTQEVSKRSVGVELNKVNREYINDIGIQCVNHLSELNNEKFDLMTIFFPSVLIVLVSIFFFKSDEIVSVFFLFSFSITLLVRNLSSCHY